MAQCMHMVEQPDIKEFILSVASAAIYNVRMSAILSGIAVLYLWCSSPCGCRGRSFPTLWHVSVMLGQELIVPN